MLRCSLNAGPLRPAQRGHSSPITRLPASDSGGLLINPEERGGGGVLAHPSQVVGAGQARQGHKVEGKLADPGGPRGWVSKGN